MGKAPPAENEDKKIALIFHNYPPKNYNIGSASGMDSMESATRLLARMQADGYKIDFLPESAEEFIRIMTSHATNDLSLLTESRQKNARSFPRMNMRLSLPPCRKKHGKR